MFGVSFNTIGGYCNANYGTSQELFPTNEDLHDIVREYNPSAMRIVVLSICELSESDYETFFKNLNAVNKIGDQKYSER